MIRRYLARRARRAARDRMLAGEAGRYAADRAHVALTGDQLMVLAREAAYADFVTQCERDRGRHARRRDTR